MIDSDLSDLWEHPLFSTLLPNQKEWLSERVKLETIPSRTTINKASEESTAYLCYILNGKVKVETTSESGNHFIKKIGLPKDFFGLKELFNHSSSDTVHTLRTPVSFVKLDGRDLRRLVEVNHDFAHSLMNLVWRELLFFEERTIKLNELSARERFADFLVEMTEREGEFNGKEWFVNSQLTQADIGAYIGTGRQTVTEILNEFREKKILRYAWGRFFVEKLEALKG